jgi:hypothetical protein
MKDQNNNGSRTLPSKKPARAKVTDAEFRLRLKNIDEWRKQRLAKHHTNGSR